MRLSRCYAAYKNSMILIVLIFGLTIVKAILHTIYLIRCDTKMDRFKNMNMVYFFMKYAIVLTPVFVGDVFGERNSSISTYRLKTINKGISICLIICYIMLITKLFIMIK